LIPNAIFARFGIYAALQLVSGGWREGEGGKGNGTGKFY
jgi:hypothetical protein